jgi:hypothetical protein
MREDHRSSLWVLIIACQFLLFFSKNAAAQETFDLTITERQPFEFSVLAKPSSTVNWTIDTNGNSSGTATQIYGSINPGVYMIECTAACKDFSTMDIHIENVSSNCTGVSFTAWYGDYDGNGSANMPIFGVKVPEQSDIKYFYVGASVQITSSATVGSCTPNFDIVIYTAP